MSIEQDKNQLETDMLDTGKLETDKLNTDRQDISKIGFDGFLEDLFGVNIRGLKTLWISFVNPKAYYEACDAPDWQNKFTPSFRLWFTLSAITVFLQFFWGGNDSTMIEAFTRDFQSSTTPLPEKVDPRAAAITFSRWYFGLLPVITAVFLLIFPAIFRAWNKKAFYVRRQRYVFVSVLPGTAIAGLFAMLNRYIPADQISAFANFSLFVFGAVSFITAFRGAFPEATLTGRVWRAGLLSACLCTIAFISAVVAVILAIVGMGLYYA